MNAKEKKACVFLRGEIKGLKAAAKTCANDARESADPHDAADAGWYAGVAEGIRYALSHLEEK